MLVGRGSASWALAVLWLVGLFLIGSGVLNLEKKPATNSSFQLLATFLLPVSFPILLILLLHYLITTPNGWGGFMHLADLPIVQWLGLLSTWSLILGLWLWSFVCILNIRKAIPDRSKRLIYLLIIALAINGAFAIVVPIMSFLPLFLTTIVFVVLQDLYADSNRTSLTWLLAWLFLIATFLSGVSFQKTLQLDKIAFQKIAEEINQSGQPDSTNTYHLDYKWDKVLQEEAAQYIPASALDMQAGAYRFMLLPNQMGRVSRTADGKYFILVSRKTGGYQPPLALASLFLLAGLLFALLLRGQSWLLGQPVHQWQLPLFGPPSLQVRIQLYFFLLALISFLLIGWFTYNFLQDQGVFVQSWLETLLALYAFLLLVAGTLGIFLADSISQPIVRIGRKLGTTKLRHNEPLTWPRNDEIGRLVANYNHMIAELDESVARLAATEREQAWREMAKQVAHEIKNPLTPMKLQLQQLLRLQKEDPDRVIEWSGRVSQTLIEQIDSLAKIATAFSDFARMPESQPILVDANELLQTAFNLYNSKGDEVQFCLKKTPNPIIVKVDVDQIKRVLTNLIRNALQAMEGQENQQVGLVIKIENDQTILSVVDNGKGIPTSIQASIFEPKFTTKSSGMGLGLAMCKNIIEQSNGQIWFETKEGKGTTFFIKLPILNP